MRVKLPVNLGNAEILWIMQIMIKLTCSTFISSNNFYIYFFSYKKMSKDLSGNYYRNNKEKLPKKLVKDIDVFLKKKKKKVTISSWRIQKSITRWKTKAFWVFKKIL